MSIIKMKFIVIIGIMSNFERLIDICGFSSFFQADDVFKIYKDYYNIKKFSNIKGTEKYGLLLRDLNNVAKKINKKFSLEMNDLIVDIEKIEKYIKIFSEKVDILLLEIKNLNDDIKKIEKNIGIIKNYENLNITFDKFNSCRYTSVLFGVIPSEFSLKFNKEKFENENFIMFKNNEYKKIIYILVFFVNEKSEEVNDYLKNIKFEKIIMPKFDSSPKEEILNLNSKIDEIKEKIKKIYKKIDFFWKNNEKFASKVFKSLVRIENSSKIRDSAAKYKNKFIIVGWVPENESENLIKKINSINGLECASEIGDKLLKFTPPTKVRNYKFFKPFEFFIETYGMPEYNDFDPTIFIAITYTILYGIMFADIGQGLLLLIIGFIMSKVKNSKLSGVIKTCGISSMFFGLIFGSVFGFENALDYFYINILKFHEKPIEIMKPKTMMEILYAAIFIGVFLIVSTMVINTYMLFKKNKNAEAFLSNNGVVGIIFYLSLILELIDFGFLKKNIFSPIITFIFIIIPIILIYLREFLIESIEHHKIFLPKDKNLAEFLLTNFFELFEVILSYFTSTLSFVRIGAFIFVHAGLMMAVFKIAELTGYFYIPIIILGNIIVTAFEGLIVGIQAMRLEFHEMFSRFYSGSGRNFSPIIFKRRSSR